MAAIRGEASEALRLATVAPERAVALAVTVERAAVLARDAVSRSLAARARGVAALQLQDPAGAIRALRVAVRSADRAGDRELAGEARMSLAAAFGVRGLADRAIAEIDAAVGDLDGLSAARARTQRAGILLARGSRDEALGELRRAVPVLRRHGDVAWQARALSTRGLLLVGRRSFGAAQADLEAALGLCEQHGLAVSAAYAEQNLGCVLAGRGDLSGALARFEAAGVRYRALGLAVGSLDSDRGEVLLSLRLVSEARAAAESAVAIQASQQRALYLPEARLLLSTAALVDGDPGTALEAADLAAREFHRLRRPEGLARARYARLQALVASDPRAVEPARARRCADELAELGWSMPALEARILAAGLARLRGQRAAARRDLTLAARARSVGPADSRSRAWYAEAVLRAESGGRRGALVALSTGLRIVEEHQLTLGATELRAHVSLHRGLLARTGLELALAGGRPRSVLRWAERGRASTALLRSPEPPADPVLARDLADLRTTMTEIATARAAGRRAGDLVRRQVELEREVSARTRTRAAQPGAGAADPAPAGGVAHIGDLSAALEAAVPGGAALVEYLALKDEFWAVTVVAGRARLRPLGRLESLRSDIEHLAFALTRLADQRSGPASVVAAEAVLSRARDRLDGALLRPLRSEIGDRPLVVAPTGVLRSLPWGVLPSCVGRPVTVSPSATVWLRTSRRVVPAGGAAVVVAGPGLPGADAEAHDVARLHPRSELLTGALATVEAVCRALSGARVAHIAAHGRLRADNPLFSSLLLADGPLLVHDLEQLRSAPDHVVLAACETARTAVLAGDEALGLASALLQQGTSSLVAPLLAVPDATTAPLVLAHHRFLLAGLAPAAALAAAQVAAARGGAGPAAVAAAFVCLGDGLTALGRPAP